MFAASPGVSKGRYGLARSDKRTRHSQPLRLYLINDNHTHHSSQRLLVTTDHGQPKTQTNTINTPDQRQRAHEWRCARRGANCCRARETMRLHVADD